MTRYIDEQRPLVRGRADLPALEIAPSSYYAARSRPPSARSVRTRNSRPTIGAVHRANFAVYGARKLWRALRREGENVGRDQVARLMSALGLAGAVRRKIRTTTVTELSPRPADLVERIFAAPAPNRLWVADLTYVWTWSGFAYTAFVIDAFSRRIVGWRVSSSPADRARPRRARDGHLEPAVARPSPTSGLVHHSDRGVQYLAIRYTERLAEEGVVTSVGARGDSYDNALAETVNGLYKTELIRAQGPWRTADQVELATAAWVSWWNERASPLRLRRHPAGRVRGGLPSAATGERGRLKPNHSSLHETQCGSKSGSGRSASNTTQPTGSVRLKSTGSGVDMVGRTTAREGFIGRASLSSRDPSGKGGT